MKKYTVGIPDEEFIRGKVPMTKEEIRILTLAKARIGRGDLVADIGAGTGSISCEAALQATDGKVFAIERKAEGIELIKANAEEFGIENLHIIQAEAPEGMEQLPQLDRAIIGGSGSHLEPILDQLDELLKPEGNTFILQQPVVSFGKAVVADQLDELLKPEGRIILNCITVQTLMQCLNYMRSKENYSYETIQVQVNHWEQVGPYDMAKAANPIFIVTCVKNK